MGLFAILGVLLMAGSFNLLTKKLVTRCGGAFLYWFFLLIQFFGSLKKTQR